MFIKLKLPGKSDRGFTLVEMMMAAGLFGVASTALLSIYLFSARSFVALADYGELDKINRNALDLVTKEIRQASSVQSFDSNAFTRSIGIINVDGVAVNYVFNTTTSNLTRQAGSASKDLISDCTLVDFDVFQKVNVSNTFNQFAPPTNSSGGIDPSQIKVIKLTWKTSRKIMGTEKVSEDIQTAKIVIRKQYR